MSPCDEVILQNMAGRLAPFSSDRQHLSYDGCLEVRGGLSELFCAVLCTEVVHSHKHT